MLSESKLGQMISQLGEKISEQTWFQQLKAKWDELDPQSRTYLQYAGVIGSALLVAGVLLSTYLGVSSLRSELSDKNQLISYIQSANDELRRLRDGIPGVGAPSGAPEENWGKFFEGIAGRAQMEPDKIAVGAEKPGTGGTDQAKEVLYDIQLKKVKLPQVTKYAFYVENSGRPVKLRNLTILTGMDPSGNMDATLSVSAFALKTQ